MYVLAFGWFMLLELLGRLLELMLVVGDELDVMQK